ncbi:MAG TPA: hypothetical protein VEB61_16430 [Candidatus Binatia bacterium]|nr:hypothetical protein [Candidatus Binatia bacterium]
MYWSRRMVLVGLISGSLMLPSISVNAYAKDGHGKNYRVNHGKHKGWDKPHGKKFDRSVHDRRDFGHQRRDIHRSARWDDQRGRRVNYTRRHHGRFDNRGHHNKAEIRQDFKDIRAARRDVREERTDLRNAYSELRKDRAELRRDIRNGASRDEIRNDRREIRQDLANIRTNRQELAADQAKLDAARRELRSDLRRR